MPTSSIPPSSRRSTRRLPWVAVLCVVVAAAGWISATSVPGGRPDVTAEVRSDVSDDVDAFVTERMQAHGLPGAAVAVLRGGEVVHLSGYGTADAAGNPATVDTPFLIASVSKPITATAVLQLVEEGRLSLEDRITDHLEGLPPGFDEITVEHLLTHTGGLGFLAGIAGAERVHDGDDALQRRVADIVSRPLSGDPGAAFSYSNGGYSLLAAVIEQVTGTSYADHVRDRVFEPLGMDRSFASDEDPPAEQLATGHSRWFGRWRPRDLPYDVAGASMGYIGSTARDLTSFMQAHLGTDRAAVVTTGLRQLAHEPVSDTGMAEPMLTGYGRGWFVGELAGHRTVGHSGELGHFTTHINLVPDADALGVAVLTNAAAPVAGQGGNYGLASDLTALLLGEEPSPAARKVLLTDLLPLAVWAGALALVLGAARFLLAPSRCRPDTPTASGLQRWLRPVVLPAVAFLAVGLPLITVAPLGLARHMAPDTGWGLTAVGYLAVTWAVVRTPLAIRAVLRSGASSPDTGTAEPAPRTRVTAGTA